MDTQKRSSWSSQFAFVIAAAASAIGLGNLWRFPYLAAQYGGGTFILAYLILTVTIGSALMITEIAIGRYSQQSQLTAYGRLNKKFAPLGLMATIVPLLIVPYYCVIGGWVLKYLASYLKLILEPSSDLLAQPGAFFSSFISAPFAPFGYSLVFIVIAALVIALGVKHGIEKSNLVLMPMLFVMAIGIAIYVCTLPGSGAGLKYCFVPNLDCVSTVDPATGAKTFSIALLGKTILGAMGQMFYSLSLAMGIMITYGSYMRKTDSIEKSVYRIEIFDTIIAVLSGMMIIPVVYLFATKTGVDVKTAMNAGPGLMFITLPMVFGEIGTAGAWLGCAFFLLVFFAALTSAISLFEACVASVCDMLGMKRQNATFFIFFMVSFLASFSALGYGAWAEVKLFGLQFLDFFDFVTNSVLMPIVAVITCILVGWVVKPKFIEDELVQGGQRFVTRGLYHVLIKYVAPVFILAILASEVCRALGIGGWKI